MTKPNPPIDWEAAMKATEANASVAAKMTERTAARLAEALDHLHLHGQQLSRMEAMMKVVATKTAAPPQFAQHSSPPPTARRYPPLLLIIAAFLLGAAFAAYIGSW